MKKILIILLSCLTSFIQAQQITVALHHNGAATMFYGNSALNDANTAAQNGDTIYLPGTAYYSGFGISKKLVIIGAGHNPDSTVATGRTIIQGDIYFYAGSDGSVLEGIYTDNNIHFNNVTRINNVRISRCNLVSIYFDGGFDTTTTCKREIIEQNIIRGGIQCSNSDWLIIRNNLISSTIYNITQNCLIENNVLYYQVSGYNYYGEWRTSPLLSSVYNSWIHNNIFTLPASVIGAYITGSNNYLDNNIFGTTPGDYSGSNWYTNNYVNIGTDTLFIGQTANYSSFDYSQNYHLRNPALFPGYSNLGVGIYGGTVPFKEGGLPFNPHIMLKTIAPNTDTNGNLNINVKVKAQDN